MPATYEPIATTTLGSAVQTVTFSSIPSTYTDLRLIIANANHSFAGTGRVFDSVLQFNNDTSSNYSLTNLYGDGSSAISARSTSQPFLQMHWSRAGDDPMLATFDIMSYANTSVNKTVIYTASTANATAATYVGLWRSTSAINEIDVVVSSGYTISANTVISLYGILKA